MVDVGKVKYFEEGGLQSLKSSELFFIHARIEVGTADVPPAPIDSAENKYTFVRYIEKSEQIKILSSPLSRASDSSKN